jgi:hypothetical protein
VPFGSGNCLEGKQVQQSPSAALSQIISIISKIMEIPVTTAQVALWIRKTPTDRGYWRHNAQELVNSRQWGCSSLVAEQWAEVCLAAKHRPPDDWQTVVRVAAGELKFRAES